ncbi:hypothetical protein J2Y55_005335 [Bosea sp. BE125]|uniref:hypothetical protein n=1 Tax=Bosea sp. BE125 TaxID=2817909 RepID=UPI002861F9EC|nr:hypothetical protein [Bosea sp. BE125]MDR6874301.1 hypothetical protein [Bosea sp. BE125]
MRIQTSLPGLTYAGLAAAVFAWICTSTGIYSISPQTLNSDRMVLLALSSAIAFSTIFAIAHVAFRSSGLSNRLAYAAAGAIGMTVALLIIMDPASRSVMFQSGEVFRSLILPAVSGWLVGTFYHWHAGFDTSGDDLEALEAAVEEHSQTMAAGGDAAVGLAAHIRTPTAEYFDGPMQVCSSFNAAVAAAVTAIMVSHISMWFFLILTQLRAFGFPAGSRAPSGKALPSGIAIPDYSQYTEALTAVLGSTLTMTLLLVIPVTLIVYATHLGLKAFGKLSYKDYGLAGLAVPLAISLPLFFALVVGLQLAIPFALAMMAYRRMAGLEPLSLPDDIQVKDRRTLIASNHARRRFARVIAKS